MTLYTGGFSADGKSATVKASITNTSTGKPTPLELRMSLGANGGHVTQLWGHGPGHEDVQDDGTAIHAHQALTRHASHAIGDRNEPDRNQEEAPAPQPAGGGGVAGGYAAGVGHLRRVAPRRAPDGGRRRCGHCRGRHDGCGGGVERRGQPGGAAQSAQAAAAQSAAAAKQAEAAAAAGQGQPDQDAAAEAGRTAVAVRPEADQRVGLRGGEDQDPQPDDAVARTDPSTLHEIETRSADGGVTRRRRDGEPADAGGRRRCADATDVRAERRRPEGRRQDAAAGERFAAGHLVQRPSGAQGGPPGPEGLHEGMDSRRRAEQLQQGPAECDAVGA